MTDTPEHIKEMQVNLWMAKTPEERLYQFIADNDAMYRALREFKINNQRPLDGLDPMTEALQKKNFVRNNTPK
ncbi:MAG TPA: hypothetical protein VF144_09895 [Chitinophagaceae bacterium]